jgi:hypothetical protein
MNFPKRMQKHISQGMEKKPKLVGFKLTTRCPVREEMRLVFFDAKFHVAATGVYFLIDVSSAGVFQIGNDESGVRPPVIVLGLINHPKRPSPGFSLILKFTKEFHRLFMKSVKLFSLLCKLFCLPPHGVLRGNAKNKSQLFLLAKIIDLRRSIMRITPYYDPNLRPGLPNLSHYAFQ